MKTGGYNPPLRGLDKSMTSSLRRLLERTQTPVQVTGTQGAADHEQRLLRRMWSFGDLMLGQEYTLQTLILEISRNAGIGQLSVGCNIHAIHALFQVTYPQENSGYIWLILGQQQQQQQQQQEAAIRLLCRVALKFCQVKLNSKVNFQLRKTT